MFGTVKESYEREMDAFRAPDMRYRSVKARFMAVPNTITRYYVFIDVPGYKADDMVKIRFDEASGILQGQEAPPEMQRIRQADPIRLNPHPERDDPNDELYGKVTEVMTVAALGFACAILSAKFDKEKNSYIEPSIPAVHPGTFNGLEEAKNYVMWAKAIPVDIVVRRDSRSIKLRGKQFDKHHHMTYHEQAFNREVTSVKLCLQLQHSTEPGEPDVDAFGLGKARGAGVRGRY